MKTNFPFSAWPYISLALLVVGVSVRYLLARKRMPAVIAEIAEAKEIFAGNRVWRISVLFLVAAHLGLLLFPRAVQTWNASAGRLYLLEGFAFVVGLVALGCWMVLLWRYLGRAARPALVELADAIFLALLFIGIFSGVAMAISYRWASAWATVTLSPYLASLLTGHPAAQFVTQMPMLVRIHVFSAFAAVAVLPLTRLSAVILPAIHTSLGVVSRPAVALGHAVAARLRKHDPAALIWPEED
jgi:nitrate reductase gamma subunit